ncbi:uncharacterized protein LOC112346443 [Selaginella moellendorffii]|uniref:uncharacterized protein LOC112346443 n=1 Tax=Selaginella moellendorffii TaxID=88036 RepID=UPI000D1C70C3|nr:uncharacterized protein LOC112346443 [Selaginella moellendorffii]|eukprot:XP_024531226.1 uncharacterized protein LOC112346443 [Selaginella moellendorffii]
MMLAPQCRFLPVYGTLMRCRGRLRGGFRISCVSALHFSGLNDEQEAAVTTTEKCVRVVAGPGSGKTLVLTHRIVHEIKHNTIDPENILCITFTNKAAQEIRHRIGSLVGIDAARKITISTFHSFCTKLLKQLLPDIKPESGLSQAFVIYDEADCEKILKDIYVKVAEGHLSECNSGASKWGLLNLFGGLEISSHTSTDKKPVHFRIPSEDLKRGLFLMRLAKGWYLERFVALKRCKDLPSRPKVLTDDVSKLLHMFEEHLRANNAADFDDLIYLTIMELHRTPSARKRFEKRWSYVLVDEFQDTDKAQYELIRLLCSENQNLFVVGDIDQAIYGWRGAESRNMQYLLGNDFPQIATFQLRKNYRSSKAILSAASKIIGNSMMSRRIGQLEALKPISIKPWTAPVKVCWLSDPTEESRFVADEIIRTRKDRWSDCAVLYRTHRQSFLLESALIKANIPYKLLGATPLFSHKVIKDLLSYLKLIHNSNDELALARIINTPPRGIGEKTIFHLKQWASERDLPLFKALLKLKEDDPGHKHLGITAKAKTAVLSFCELLESLTKLSEKESSANLLQAVIDKTQFIKYLEEHTEDQRIFEKRCQVVEQFKESADSAEGKHGKGRRALAGFLEDVMLITSDDKETNKEHVGLLTLHASKGMEFPCVFIVGVNAGILPHENSDPEEERRLFYVGITRAKEQLYLTHTHSPEAPHEKSFPGSLCKRQRMSAFLDEIISSEPVELYPKSWTGKFAQGKALSMTS